MRCGTCGHSWLARPDEEKAFVPPAAPVPDARHPVSDDVVGRESVDDEMRTVLAPVMHREEDGGVIDRPPSRRMTKIVTVLAAVIALGAAGTGVVMTASQPKIASTANEGPARPRIEIAVATPPSRTGPEGQRTIATTARISNASRAPLRVPQLEATLRTVEGRTIRTWRMRPDATLAPGGDTLVRIGTTAKGVPEGELRLDVTAVADGAG